MARSWRPPRLFPSLPFPLPTAAAGTFDTLLSVLTVYNNTHIIARWGPPTPLSHTPFLLCNCFPKAPGKLQRLLMRNRDTTFPLLHFGQGGLGPSRGPLSAFCRDKVHYCTIPLTSSPNTPTERVATQGAWQRLCGMCGKAEKSVLISCPHPLLATVASASEVMKQHLEKMGKCLR